MIGNDIVSRSFIRSLKDGKRFIERILTERERSSLMQDKNLEETACLFWAAKEAAFKVYMKLGGKRKLNPKNFEVALEGNELKVRDKFHDMQYDGSLEIEKDYVHAILQAAPTCFSSGVLLLHSGKRKTQSDRIAAHMCESLKFTPQAITKNRQNIPTMNGWDLSFSHCGEWGAWVAQKD